MSDADREDLLQEILLHVKESLVESFDRSRGKFRALLQTAVERKVIDFLRRQRKGEEVAAEWLASPAQIEFEAIELESNLLDAVAACHDHFTQGEDQDLEVVWTLTDLLVNRLKSTQIASKSGLTKRQVAGRLSRAREVIFAHFLALELDLELDSPRTREAVELFKACLRQPRQRSSILEAATTPALREPLAEFFERFLASVTVIRGLQSARYVELTHGIESIFSESSSWSVERSA